MSPVLQDEGTVNGKHQQKFYFYFEELCMHTNVGIMQNTVHYCDDASTTLFLFVFPFCSLSNFALFQHGLEKGRIFCCCSFEIRSFWEQKRRVKHPLTSSSFSKHKDVEVVYASIFFSNPSEQEMEIWESRNGSQTHIVLVVPHTIMASPRNIARCCLKIDFFHFGYW